MVLTYEESMAVDALSEFLFDFKDRNALLLAPCYAGPWPIISQTINNFGIENHKVLLLTMSQKVMVQMCKLGYACEYIPEYIYDHYYVTNGKDGVIDKRVVKENLYLRDSENHELPGLIVIIDGEYVTKEIVNDINVAFNIQTVIMGDPFRIRHPKSILNKMKPTATCEAVSEFSTPIQLYAYELIQYGKFQQSTYSNIKMIKQSSLTDKKMMEYDIVLFPYVEQAADTNQKLHVSKTGHKDKFAWQNDKIMLLSNDWYETLEDDKYYCTAGLIGKANSGYYNKKLESRVMSFKPDFTVKAFDKLPVSLDNNTRDDVALKYTFAYALSVSMACRWKFDNVLYISNKTVPDEQMMLAYTALTLADKKFTIAY
jgi:hypothetical protein